MFLQIFHEAIQRFIWKFFHKLVGNLFSSFYGFLVFSKILWNLSKYAFRNRTRSNFPKVPSAISPRISCRFFEWVLWQNPSETPAYDPLLISPGVSFVQKYFWQILRGFFRKLVIKCIRKKFRSSFVDFSRILWEFLGVSSKVNCKTVAWIPSKVSPGVG